ncbi:DUF1059 domain-containing protein [Fulvivirga ligni]|uniref:DUF1059 domain-containing protein n=1 Tax=Fulvivirga ligni TaxID=2904246 RepID=UPI001F1BE8CE|nr:DUF1059 domain-containing protein [Fulvivirga ligni]UII20273.1 DUF1059 domain-containing protein [Fulvivirga ligni]
MKIMTCKQLGGACEKEFHAETFKEMSDLSQKHGMEMFQKGDKDHIEAMEHMRDLMQNPESMRKWMAAKKVEFDALPEVDG